MFLLFYNQTPTHIVFHNIYILSYHRKNFKKKYRLGRTVQFSGSLLPTDHSLSTVRAISESRLYLQTPNPVGAVLRCTHPNAICIPNRTIGVNLAVPNPVGAVLRCTHPNAICIPNQCRIPHAYSAGSSAEPLDMDNPENLVILKILVQTDAVRFRVPFCIRPPFSPHTVRVCYSSTCARIAHLNTPALRYNEFLSKTPYNDFFKTTSISLLPSFKKRIPTHLR